MTSTTGLSRLQTSVIAHLANRVASPEPLAQHCPLDYGRHSFASPGAQSLGTLARLPVELQQQIILALDIESILVFRRVSQHAQILVNSLVEWKKITTHAPDTLCTAIGLRRHSKITLPALTSILHSRTCSESRCPNLAPYINMRTLRRVCLSHNCPSKPPSRYTRRYCRFIRFVTNPNTRSSNLGPSSADKVALTRNDGFPLWLGSQLLAPWLRKGSMEADWGIYCPFCKDGKDGEGLVVFGALRGELVAWTGRERVWGEGELRAHVEACHGGWEEYV